MYDLLVAGEINPDLILSGDVVPAFSQVEKLIDSAILSIGSSSVIFACGAARLGLRVAFLGVCGEDIFGRFMLEEMRKRSIDTSHVIVKKEGRTGLSVILNRTSDRAILTFPGLIGELSAEDVPDELLNQCRHLHVASYFLQPRLQPGLPGLFQRAHQRGLTTSLDTNYDPTEQWAGLDALLPDTDVFFPNETELLSITRSAEIETGALQLAQKAQVVAVKLGPRGALACSQGVRLYSGSIPVQVVDTVGAGDSFDAGFIYGYLEHWPLERSLRLGCVCGALSTRQAGGTAAQPILNEALTYVPA